MPVPRALPLLAQADRVAVGVNSPVRPHSDDVPASSPMVATPGVASSSGSGALRICTARGMVRAASQKKRSSCCTPCGVHSTRGS